MSEFFNVLTPADAWGVFRQHYHPKTTAEVMATAQALDRFLAEAPVAPHDLPQFRRSTVDGYAVRARDTFGASPGLPAFLEVVGEVPMGAAAAMRLAVGQAALVHTGGMIPDDADAVVMLENTQRVDERSIEVLSAVAVGENVIQVGEDIAAGQQILPAGHRLRPQDIGGLLALGIVEVRVARPPRVAIISTGDEVIPPEQEPGPGQVRDINSYTLAALALRAGGEPVPFGIIPDDKSALEDAVHRARDICDLVVLSAGSSVSYRDMSVEVLSSLGKPGVLAHGISIRPGKPTIIAVADGKAFFGLPGNPVSAMVLFDLFVAPAIRLHLGADPFGAYKPRLRARLARQIASAAGREDHVQVRLEEREGELWAVPVFGKSNLIYTLVHADGVVRVPLDSLGLEQGSWVEVTLHQ
ncbi:MAG: molybdopterin molybdenumtransferase MoeA [Caldilineae bacterium]|nr:MAG: molybdopterin molybdenumtransferase MoeA [Caldilineae bacterium]